MPCLVTELTCPCKTWHIGPWENIASLFDFITRTFFHITDNTAIEGLVLGTLCILGILLIVILPS